MVCELVGRVSRPQGYPPLFYPQPSTSGSPAPGIDVRGYGATLNDSILPISIEARARPRSYKFCKFNQNSGVIPRACPKRTAVSAVMERRPWTISLMRRGGCADHFRQAVLADSEFVENLRQVFSRMNRVDIGHGFIFSDSP